MRPTTQKRPSCPFCDPDGMGFPELIPSGRTSPKDYMCPYGSSCKGVEDRPYDFNYFTTDGKPIPYEPPKDGKAGYSPQPGKAFSTKNDLFANDPANAPNLTKTITFNPPSKPSLAYCLKELGAPENEVFRDKTGNGYKKYKLAVSELQDAELLDWAEYLYKEKLKKYHPDLHLEEWKKYSEYCAYLGEMINRVRRILHGRM